MEMKFAERLNFFEEGVFTTLNDKKNELLAQGRKVYNLSVGTPDFKPAKHIMDVVAEACTKPENYKYSLADMPELLDAVIKRYETRYNVPGLTRDQVMSVYGSQEGVAHIGMVLADPGDIVLVPNPGYPVFSAGPMLAGAKLVNYDLHEENGYLIEFDKIDEELARSAKAIIVSYPLNPVCATAPDSFYEELIAWAKKHNVIVIHDNAYSDIVFDAEPGKSFLCYEGAMEVGCEFYSLSKSFNYTGARCSFVVGNKDIVAQFKKLRSQIDYGIFTPIQLGAIAALEGPMDEVLAQCEEYNRRNHALSESMTEAGWPIPLSKGTMFAWTPIPEGFESSVDFVMKLMDKTGIIVTPGSAFGSLGEGYVRLALVQPVEVIKEAAQVLKESGLLSK